MGDEMIYDQRHRRPSEDERLGESAFHAAA